jgi:hypothetical protein
MVSKKNAVTLETLVQICLVLQWVCDRNMLFVFAFCDRNMLFVFAFRLKPGLPRDRFTRSAMDRKRHMEQEPRKTEETKWSRWASWEPANTVYYQSWLENPVQLSDDHWGRHLQQEIAVPVADELEGGVDLAEATASSSTEAERYWDGTGVWEKWGGDWWQLKDGWWHKWQGR